MAVNVGNISIHTCMINKESMIIIPSEFYIEVNHIPSPQMPSLCGVRGWLWIGNRAVIVNV